MRDRKYEQVLRTFFTVWPRQGRHPLRKRLERSYRPIRRIVSDLAPKHAAGMTHIGRSPSIVRSPS